MENKDIIKALECCKNNEKEETYKYCSECFCGGCELNESEDNCYDVLFGRTIELIKNQQAEIEELKEKRIEDDKLLTDRVDEAINAVIKAHLRYENVLEEHLKTAKTEAYKEVFNKLRKGLKWLPLTVMNERFITEGQINDLEKELTERKEI